MIKSAVEQIQGPPQGGGVSAFEGYINKHECARLLGRTVRSVDTYMARGIIPFYKLGRTVAFKWSEVDAYIKAHCRVGVGGR
jgi:excisionase family DNA binding protein